MNASQANYLDSNKLQIEIINLEKKFGTVDVIENC